MINQVVLSSQFLPWRGYSLEDCFLVSCVMDSVVSLLPPSVLPLFLMDCCGLGQGLGRAWLGCILGMDSGATFPSILQGELLQPCAPNTLVHPASF